ncbi:MAG: hypothetical protein CM15mP89_5260 [Gammaproteobacteria bacterium]|nr:MAG: hypothetical protein CM15mP89_5260 [Gammaproteobacteria bacterium]
MNPDGCIMDIYCWMVLRPINRGQQMPKPFGSTTTRSTLMLRALGYWVRYLIRTPETLAGGSARLMASKSRKAILRAIRSCVFVTSTRRWRSI